MKKTALLISMLIVLLNCFSVISFAEDEAEAPVSEILTVSTDLQVEVNAKACVLMDANTGTVIAAFNEHDKLYPASVTKIMTLLLVMEAVEAGKLTLEMEVTCSESAAEKGGSQIWLEPGEVMTVNDLLKATVVYSANDACCLLGECISGSETAFCDLMNKKAAELGMNDTHFDNCTGLDDDTETHKSSAYDIALMSRELLKYDLIRDYTGIWMDTLRNGETQLVNTNKIIRTYPGATGLKTGTTSKAGCCVSASAERDGLELIAVILGADNSKDRFKAAENLLDYGFSNYEIYSPDAEELYPDEIRVTHGTEEFVSLSHSECDDFLINKGIKNQIKTELIIDESIEAPVEKGTIIGEIVYKVNNEVLGKTQILSDDAVDRMTFFNAIITLLKSFKKY